MHWAIGHSLGEGILLVGVRLEHRKGLSVTVDRFAVRGCPCVDIEDWTKVHWAGTMPRLSLEEQSLVSSDRRLAYCSDPGSTTGHSGRASTSGSNQAARTCLLRSR
jgi:hypothetical protein